MTSSTVLAALGVLTLVGRRYSPSPVRSRRRAASSRGADAIRTAEEDRRPAGHRANRPTGSSRHRSRSTQSPELPMPCLELENNTAGRCSGPAGAGEVFI